MFRRSRPKADWVYRSALFDDTGAIIDQLHTYDSILTNQAPGVAGTVVRVLYDSSNRMRTLAGIGGANSVLMTRANRAEASLPLILGADIHVSFAPSVWALGSTIRWAIRVMPIEQDPDDGLLLIDANYTMWEPAGAGLPRANVFANEKRNIWTHRIIETFAAQNNARFDVTKRLRFRRRLEQEHALCILCSSASSGVGLSSLEFWCRTLVADEG